MSSISIYLPQIANIIHIISGSSLSNDELVLFRIK